MNVVERWRRKRIARLDAQRQEHDGEWIDPSDPERGYRYWDDDGDLHEVVPWGGR